MLETISVDERNNNGSLTLDVGTILTMTLQENATTGFKWHFEPYDENVLKLESDTYLAAALSGIGGGGSRLLKFRTIAAGQTVLSLLKRRAWDEREHYREQFSIDISVR